MDLDFQTALEIMGLPENFNLEQLRCQYQERSKKYHPQFTTGKETEYLILGKANLLLQKYANINTVNSIENKSSFKDYLEEHGSEYSDVNSKEKIDHSKFEQDRKKLFYNDSIPEMYNSRNILELKANRCDIAVEDFIGEDIDNKTFNEIFEYNKRKFGDNTLVESNGIDYSFGGNLPSLQFQDIIKTSDQELLPVNEEYRPLFNDSKIIYEKKRYSEQPKFKDTKAKLKELEKSRKEKLEYNNSTKTEMESNVLSKMRRELSENDTISKKIKSVLRIK